MGAPKPWPTRWPEPAYYPSEEDGGEVVEPPDYEIEETPQEDPYPLPEESLTPKSATWGITHPCNLKCIHCYDVVDYKRHDLKTHQALEVIDRLAQVGINFIVFSGGEPLLRKDLFDLMAYCDTRNIAFGMRSNATLVTRETAQLLGDLKLAVAGISLDGASADIHDSVRGSGTFDKTMQGIEVLLENGVRVNIEIVLSRRNAHQALEFVQLAENLGVQEINFSTLTPQGRGQLLHDDFLDYPAWRDITTQLYHASQAAKITISPSCAFVGTCVSCLEPNITCDGWVTPCYLSKRKLFHILETPVEDIIARLQQARLGNLDVCGRPTWARNPV